MNHKNVEPPKTPMEKFVAVFFNDLFSLVGLNVLFILTSIPIITIGASLGALHKLIIRLTNGEEVSLFKDYFHEFRANFKICAPYGICEFLVIVLVGISIYYYAGKVSETPLFSIFIIIGIMLLFLTLVISNIFYPMAVYVNLSPTTLIKNSFFLSLGGKIQSIFALLVTVIIEFGFIFFFQYTFPLLIFFSFSFAALLKDSFIYPLIDKHVIIHDEKK